MRRLRPLYVLLFTSLMFLGVTPSTVFAQGKKGGADVPAPPPDDTPAPPPSGPSGPSGPDATPGGPEDSPTAEKKEKLSPEKRWEEAQKTWKNIVVLPRKSFLKRMRIAVTPFIGTTINDQMIQHTAVGGEVNFFLTDILSVGARGTYYISNVLADEFWTRYHFKRVPTLNRYIFSVTGNFSYSPIYGKFTLFNRSIFQYEIFLTGGVGVTQTEVIPRSFENEPFTSYSLTILLPTIGGRFFFTRWLAAQVDFSLYHIVDRFEATGRTSIVAQTAIDNEETESRYITNMVFTAGLAVFFPLDFKYTTFR